RERGVTLKVRKKIALKISGKMMLIITLLMAALFLAGCGQGKVPAQSISEPLKVALVLDQGGLGDGGFNDAAHRGLTRAKEDFSDKLEISTVTPKDMESMEAELKRIAQNQTDLVIAMGYYYTDILPQVAAAYPDIKFVLIDNKLPDLKAEGNLISLTFKDQEGAFLAGAAAALKSRTGKIGFVGGVEVPAVKNFEAGYTAGAKHINPGIKIYTAYAAPGLEGFSLPEKGKELALEQIGDGADVIFHAAGATGLGVFEAVAEKKVLAIGVDLDQTFVVPEAQRPYILTSVLKGVDVAVYDVIKLRLEDKLTGGYLTLGLKDGVENYAENEVNKELLTEIKPRLDEIKQQIAGGAFTVSGFEE
ncbi:MAG TPA: BMP family ABC transporter substrate-binding protein, partial [Anaerovoracaceae bacterium]|nr:BMP family ABC transporter substrate-binding protein [Anaerovoracaceae bacterium]